MSQLFSQYKQMFDNMVEGAFFQGADGTLYDVNPAALEMFGLTLDQFMGRTSYHPEWRVIDEQGEPLAPEQYPSMLALRTGKKVPNFVAGVFNPHKKGFTWLNISAFPMFRSGESAPYQVCVTLNDITPRILAERQLEETSERFRRIMELSPDIISVIDSNGNLLYNSPAALRIHGYTQEDLADKNTLDLIHPDDLTKVSDTFQSIICSPGQPESVNYRYRNKDGSYRLMECRAVNHLADPHINGIIAVSRAVTEMEQSLQSSEAKFAAAFNLSPALMSISTLDEGRYIDVNDRFCRVSGFDRQDITGMTSVELGWIPAEKREEMKAILQRDGQINDVELELKRKDGAVIHVLYTAAVITIAGQDRLLSIALDITERKKNQDKLDYLSECFSQALNGSRHILYRLNVKKGGYDYLSPAAEKIHGIPYADSLGYSLEQVFDCIHHDDRIRISALIDDAIRTRTSNSIDLELEYRIRKTDGSYTWLLDSTRLVVDDTGEMQYFFGSAYDINTLNETKQSLLASEERYRAIVNSQTEFVFRHLPGGLITFVNDAICRYWSVTPADINGTSFYLFLHKDDLQAQTTALEALTPENPCVNAENRVNFLDGSVHWHSWTHQAIFAQDGTVVEYQSVGRDITAHKLAEQTRNSYEEKLNLALKAAMAGMWDRDLNTDRITWSRETFILYGMDPEQDEATMEAWQRVLHPDDMARIKGSIKESIEEHADFNVDYRIILPDGSIRWLKAIGQPVYDNAGRPLRMSGITLDITERKKQGEALHTSERMAQAILGSTNDLIVFFSPEGTVLLANEALAERFGLTVEEVIGTNIFSYFADDIRRVRQEKLAEVLRTAKTLRYEDARAGRYYEHCLFPVINAENSIIGVTVFTRDITEQKQYEVSLKKTHDELETRVAERTASLERANEQIRQISFQLIKAGEAERMRIAAELHDQVGQSLLLAKMKIDALTSYNTTARDLESAAEISSLLENCIQEIRTLTFAMRPPLLDTAGFEAALEWLCKSIKESYQVQVEFNCYCRSIPLNSENRYSLYQAVRELLLNVVKHAGVSSAQLSLKSVGNNLLVQVSDKGNGFETTSGFCSSASGIGFGLFNVQQRIEMMGGSCRLDSKPGKGTDVTLNIPMEGDE